MKRLFIFLSIICSLQAYAQSSFKVGGIVYGIKNPREVYIGSNQDTTIAGNLVIPDSVAYKSVFYKVTSIYSSAFYKCKLIESIVLPVTIKSINSSAFANCAALKSINLPDSVNYIGMFVFRNCVSLTSIKIPASIIDLERNVFENCIALTTVENYLNDSVINSVNYNNTFLGCNNIATVTSAYGSIFGGSPNIKSFIVPDSCVSIYLGEFASFPSLEHVYIPASVTNITGQASNTNAVYHLDENNKNYISIDSVIYSKDTTALICCSPAKKGEVNIPLNVTKINNDAFSGCSRLSKINMHDNITSIGNWAFSGCSSIIELIIPLKVTAINYEAFSGCSSLSKINMPDSITTIGYSAFAGCSSLKEVNIPLNVTLIDAHAFSGCSSLSKINLPDNIDSIGTMAFTGCSSLKEVKIPLNVTSLSFETFARCSSLAKVYLHDNFTTIDNAVFKDCTSLSEISIPTSVTTIGYEAFSGCASLGRIELKASNIADKAFSKCTNLSVISLHSSVKRIGNGNTFDYSTNVRTFYNYSSIPQYLKDYKNDFTNIDKNLVTLFVPKGAVDTFKNAYQWQDFPHILEFDSLTTRVLSIDTAGNLQNMLTSSEKASVSNLAIIGHINAKDIYFMRDSMPNLTAINIQGAIIDSYTGIVDTTLFRSSFVSKTFLENTLPIAAFRNKANLSFVALPISLVGIQDNAFSGCTSLKTLVVNNVTPIDLSLDPFQAVDKLNCSLCIPTGSEATYRSASVWQAFYTTTNISNKTESELSIVVKDGKLSASNLPVGATLAIYNLQGIKLYSASVTSSIQDINLPTRGMYVVKVGNESVKVVY